LISLNWRARQARSFTFGTTLSTEQGCPYSLTLRGFELILARLFGFGVLKRVPGLPVTDCAVSSNNLAPWCPKVSAIDVTAQTIFERRFVFCFWTYANLRPESTVPVHPHPHCSLYGKFSISVQFFPQVAPNLFVQHDSSSNLSESRYRRPQGFGGLEDLAFSRIWRLRGFGVVYYFVSSI